MVALDASVIRPPLSGVHYAVRHEAAALLEATPDSLCLTQDPELLAYCRQQGHHALALPGVLRHVAARVFWQQLLLPGLLRRRHCQALVALAYTAPWRCPVPYALHVHDTIALRRPELCTWLNARHMRTLMPASLRQAQWVFCSSSVVAGEVQRLAGVSASRIAVAPLGVDPLFQAPADPSPWTAYQPYLLFVGNLEPKKGLDTLAAAYAQIAAETGYSLLLAGRYGWKCGALARQLDGWSGPGRVLRLGYLPRAQLPGLYAGAAAFVLPSREEGFGLGLLEAMACGTPVVHSNHPVLLETGGGHGLSFAAGDAGALALALRRLQAEPGLRAELVARGRRHVQRFTWANWAQTVRQATGFWN